MLVVHFGDVTAFTKIATNKTRSIGDHALSCYARKYAPGATNTEGKFPRAVNVDAIHCPSIISYT